MGGCDKVLGYIDDHLCNIFLGGYIYKISMYTVCVGVGVLCVCDHSVAPFKNGIQRMDLLMSWLFLSRT